LGKKDDQATIFLAESLIGGDANAQRGLTPAFRKHRPKGEAHVKGLYFDEI